MENSFGILIEKYRVLVDRVVFKEVEDLVETFYENLSKENSSSSKYILKINQSITQALYKTSQVFPEKEFPNLAQNFRKIRRRNQEEPNPGKNEEKITILKVWKEEALIFLYSKLFEYDFEKLKEQENFEENISSLKNSLYKHLN